MSDQDVEVLRQQYDCQTVAWTAMREQLAQLPTNLRLPSGWFEDLAESVTASRRFAVPDLGRGVRV